MITILHLTSLKCGGAESVLINYYKAINKSEVQFDFLVFSNSKEFYEDEVIKHGGTIIKADPNHRLKSGYDALKKLARTKKYAAIEIHTENAHSLLWVFLAYITGFSKVIVHSHSTSNKKIIEHKLCRLVLNQFPIIRFACGMAASEYMFGGKNAYIINNAIDLRNYKFDYEKRKKVREELRIEDSFVIGHVGRFIELKNQRLLVEICKKMIDDGERVTLLLIGDGETRNQVENLVKKRGIADSVVFTGNVNNVSDFMQAMDLFALPSYYEGFPTVIVEAQANGLPCIVSDTITNEVNISGNVWFASIDNATDIWVDKIQRLAKIGRIDNFESLSEAGLNIHKEAIKLQKIYESIDVIS